MGGVGGEGKPCTANPLAPLLPVIPTIKTGAKVSGYPPPTTPTGGVGPIAYLETGVGGASEPMSIHRAKHRAGSKVGKRQKRCRAVYRVSSLPRFPHVRQAIAML